MIERHSHSSAADRQVRLGGWLLGVALSGFFDGILFHQILQWHHLLSLVPGVGGLARQVLFDGLFHVAMYFFALAGLLLLFQGRASLKTAGAGRRLIVAMLIGFGAWNIADVIVNHWLLQIHRARVDVADPLPWDIGWLVVLGLLPVGVALALRRGGDSSGSGSRGKLVASISALVLIGSGAWAALPPPDAEGAVIVFRPDTRQADAFAAVIAAGGRPLSISGPVWAVRWMDDARPINAYSGGALFVSSSLLGAGCLGWSQDKPGSDRVS